mgnify:CR=1 FL=1
MDNKKKLNLDDLNSISGGTMYLSKEEQTLLEDAVNKATEKNLPADHYISMLGAINFKKYQENKKKNPEVAQKYLDLSQSYYNIYNQMNNELNN